MQNRSTLSALAIAAILLTGCATHVTSMPLQPVVEHTTTGPRVALYFGAQAHPAVRKKLGEVSASARIARSTDNREAACNRALSDALDKLRADAHEHHANAVIDIRSSFHKDETESATHFTCGVSGSAAALRVHGQMVVLEPR
jgi:uncharacterized protein YbjQ (UPF0145 family)